MITLFQYWQYVSRKKKKFFVSKNHTVGYMQYKTKKNMQPSKTLFITIYIELVCIHFMNGTIITDC